MTYQAERMYLNQELEMDKEKGMVVTTGFGDPSIGGETPITELDPGAEFKPSVRAGPPFSGNGILGPLDLSDEEMREYEWQFVLDGMLRTRTYTIYKPRKFFMREGGTTHRILDAEGVVHCVPAPGFFGCALRWLPVTGADPVKF